MFVIKSVHILNIFRLGIDIENLSDLDSDDEESISSKSEKSSEDQSVCSTNSQEQSESVSMECKSNTDSNIEVTSNHEINVGEHQENSSGSENPTSSKVSQEENSKGQTVTEGHSSSTSIAEPEREPAVSIAKLAILFWNYFSLVDTTYNLNFIFCLPKKSFLCKTKFTDTVHVYFNPLWPKYFTSL